MTDTVTHRILVVDDNQAILDDYRSVLDTREDDHLLDELERLAGGGEPVAPPVRVRYRPVPARQGTEAVELAAEALAAGRPFPVAFVDVRMPPGIDGLATVERLWRQQPELEVVLCTAHTDYSWSEITRRLAPRDRLVILRKPFEPIEVRQLAACLVEKARRRDAVAEQRRRAERLESIGRLAAGLAHEINTPAQYIGANLEYLAEAVERIRAGEIEGDLAAALDELPTVIDDCREGIERIAGLVRNMRSYSHMRDAAPRVRCDLNRELRAAVELTRPEYKYDAELELQLGELPPVDCARFEIAQVFVNLLINASHAIRARGDGRPGRITVCSRVVGDHVEVEIADTGIGIPDEVRARIFEPFFTTKPSGEGTGQGLAIARAAIEERHGGSLTFESVPGEGTRFFVRLPVSAGAVPLRATG